MYEAVFSGPSGKKTRNPTTDFLHQIILDPPADYWIQGSGDACLDWVVSKTVVLESLLILPNFDFGFYLKYLHYDCDRIAETWLSLHDRSRLEEVTTCSDEWHASVGLFLEPEMAIFAIDEFARTGQRCTAIEWISPAEIPERGNY